MPDPSGEPPDGDDGEPPDGDGGASPTYVNGSSGPVPAGLTPSSLTLLEFAAPPSAGGTGTV